VADPDPPKGAVLRFPGGRELPVTLLYEGTDERGRRCWQALVPWVDGIGEADLFFDDDPTGHVVTIEYVPRDI
jgi:hypothetical protein